MERTTPNGYLGLSPPGVLHQKPTNNPSCDGYSTHNSYTHKTLFRHLVVYESPQALCLQIARLLIQE